MPSLMVIIRSEARAHRDEDPLKVATGLVSSLSKKQLVEAIGHEIQYAQRDLARNLEKTAFPQFFTALRSIPAAVDDGSSSPDDLLRLQQQIEQKNLMNQAVALGDGTKVRIGNMTRIEHRIRAGFLRQMAIGISETAEWHETADVELGKARVKCLNDLSKRSKTKLEKKLKKLRDKNGRDSLSPALAT